MEYASKALHTALAATAFALCAGMFAAPASAMGFWTPPAGVKESGGDIEHREDACNRAKVSYLQAVESDHTAGRTYALDAHPAMKARMVRAYPDCLAAVLFDATNPQYNLSIGTIMLLLSAGNGANDVHLHGIAYVQNAAAYGYRKQDPIAEARACAVADAFALDGEFRCSRNDIDQANSEAVTQFASLDPIRQRVQKQDDQFIQLLIAEQSPKKST